MPQETAISKRAALALFVAVIVIWGTNWTVTKIVVASVPPIWTTVIRSLIAVFVLFILQIATRQFIIPKRGDIPVILVVSLLHMVLFATLMAVALQYISVGRSVVLGYTTPLWVAPGAWFFLREGMPPRRIAGVFLGLLGLLVLLNPATLDWKDSNAVFGNALLLVAAVGWAVSILYIKAHTWISSPFQLVLWQNLLAAVVLLVAALTIEGPLNVTVTPKLTGLFLYSGILATAFGFWGITIINKTLSATTTSLGLLATPVAGVVSSLAILGEKIDLPLVIAGGMILCGIMMGAVNAKQKK